MNSWKAKNILNCGLAIVFIFCIYALVFHTIRSNAALLFALYTGAFSSYYLLAIRPISSSSYRSKAIWLLIGLGIITRILLIFAMPNLSDDVFRFVWDGRLLVHGYNPFDALPNYYLDNTISINGIDSNLYEQLNSKSYFTIYPPVLQSIFALSALLSPNSIYGSVIVMKSILVLFEILSIFSLIKLLEHFKLSPDKILLYALNPLIIIEIVGNIHFEGAMISFTLFALLLLIKNKKHLSAISMALAVVSKLLPLMFLPLFIKKLGWKKSIVYFSIIGFTTIILFAPLISQQFLHNIYSSLSLYFASFEFNGSFYLITRWLGFQFAGYNLIGIIGPLLGLVCIFSIIIVAFLPNSNTQNTSYFSNLPKYFLYVMTIYLFSATTVHPWYVTSLVAFSVLTNYRYPILWSFLIFFTYINYSYKPYFENMWVVFIEYFILIVFMFFEFRDVSRKNIQVLYEE